MLIAETQIKLAIFFMELKLEEIIPRETLEKIFKDTEHLLHFIDSVAAAASNGKRIRIVKNVN